ncbi:hypothetical protein FDP41_007444 [Naegleria fowleri]|uniref:Uncharacterized protein n=1 Tax=Naegleria fowleri TaxID=5763 RepID=A0A6A5C4P4_NAEFO|nr:uncharacterized protein FDP41_007444 [Naegleria fowleri]KAF0984267.1 hypothetical protein FDP41_007444 [Naegleria fowleri]CAG4718098.1 unnamed protein product [Naegleria fowleri]
MFQGLIQSDYFSNKTPESDEENSNNNHSNNNHTNTTTLNSNNNENKHVPSSSSGPITTTLSQQQGEASTINPSLQISNSNNNSNNNPPTSHSQYSPPSNISLYFQYIANLDFIQAHTLLRNYQEMNQPQKLGSLHSSVAGSSSNSYSSSTLSKYKQNEEEVIQSLKRFIQCETLYYDANYSPNEKQDLHSLYSLLSSNLSLIAMNAPYEYVANLITNNNNSNNNHGSVNSPYMDMMHHSNSMDPIHSTHDNLLMMMSMMDQTSSSHLADTMNSTTTSSTSVVDYIVYKTGGSSSLSPTTQPSSHYYHQLTLIDKELILSKQIIKDFRMLIQLRLEIIAFYRILSRYKHPPKYDNYVRIINSLKSKYINRIGHVFFEKIVQNINMELNTLTSLFECEYNICNYKYKESVFTMWKTKHLFKQWNELFYKWKIEMNEMQYYYWTQTCTSRGGGGDLLSTTASSTSQSLQQTTAIPHLGNVHSNQQQQQPPQLPQPQTQPLNGHYVSDNHHHTTAPSASIDVASTASSSSTTTDSTNIHISKNNPMKKSNMDFSSHPNNLNKTNLFKWMTMIFGFSQSKFTLIFHDIITNQSSMIVNNLLNSANGTLSPTVLNENHSPLIPPSLAVDYIQWIKSFNEIVRPESVCLIYNASHDHLDTTPILEIDPEKGYTMRIRSQENTEDLSLSGIKLYPCVFHYPNTIKVQEGSTSSNENGATSTTTTTNTSDATLNVSERKITKQTLMYTYWPNILSLIMENGSDLEVAEEAFYFTDPKTFTTYYLCMVTPKLYLASIVIKPTSKDHQIALKFMAQMNNFIRNRKVFNYLTSVIPQQPPSRDNGKGSTAAASSQTSPHSAMKMKSPTKSAKFSLFGGSKKK